METKQISFLLQLIDTIRAYLNGSSHKSIQIRRLLKDNNMTRTDLDNCTKFLFSVDNKKPRVVKHEEEERLERMSKNEGASL